MARTMSLSEWCEAVETHRIRAETAVYRVNRGQHGHDYSPATKHWDTHLPLPQEDTPLSSNCRDMVQLLDRDEIVVRCGCLREQFQCWWPKCVLMQLLAKDVQLCMTVEVGPEMALFQHQVVFAVGTGDMYILTVDWADLKNEAVQRFFWH